MFEIIKTTRIKQAFDIQKGEVISLTGGGGKTTLMYSMAKELTGAEELVITTSTTKIMAPSNTECPDVFISRIEKDIRDYLLSDKLKSNHVTIAKEKIGDSGKLKGLDPEIVSRLRELKKISYIVVEADGAAQRPLKAPDIQFEPVIPEATTLTIPVVGIDVLGLKMDDQNVFRFEIASDLTGTALGQDVSIKTIAILVTHPRGLTYHTPPEARIIPFINKIETSDDLSNGRDLAYEILRKDHPQIRKVALGHARSVPAMIEIVKK